MSPFGSFPSRTVVESTPPEIVENGAPEFEVHDILDTQLVNGTRMFLVSWIGYDHSHDSWEPLENLENCGELVLEYLKGVGPEKLVDRDLALHFGKLKDKFGQGGLSCSLRSHDVKKRGTKD